MISDVNYNLLYSKYKSGDLNCIDIPGKENNRKVYRLGKSLKFKNIIDKLIQRIDRIFSALPKFFHWDWPKKHLERKSQEMLRNFSKKTIDNLPELIKTRSANVLHSYSQSSDFALLPFETFQAISAGKTVPYNFLNDHFIDIFKTQLLPSLDWKSSQNFFESQLPTVPLGNKNAGFLYLELAKEGKFKLKLSSLMAALRLCGAEVRSLDLRQLAEEITDDDIKIICHLCPKLTALNLKNCGKIGDKGLQEISQLKHLNALNISKCKRVTNNGIRHLSKLISLRKLQISSCNKITNTAFKHLNKLQNLMELSMAALNNISTSVAVKLVNKLNKVSDLHFSFDDPLFLTKLKFPERIQKLNIKRTKCLQRPDIIPFNRFKNLIELNIASCRISEENLKSLSKLIKLEKLNLSGDMSVYKEGKGLGSIKDSHTAFLSKLLNLKDLKLRHHKSLFHHTLMHLTKLTKLNKIDFSGSKTILRENNRHSTNPGLEDLSQLTSLTELNLRGCLYPTYIQSETSSLSNLVNLVKLQGGIVTNREIMKSLSELKKLKVLEVDGIISTELESLASMSNLHTLKLMGSGWHRVTDESFKYLCKLTSLSDLRIDNFCNISKEKAEILNQLGLNALEIGLGYNANEDDVQNLAEINIHTKVKIFQNSNLLSNAGKQMLKNLPPRFEINRVKI